MSTKVKFSTNNEGERVVVMQEKVYQRIQKKLDKLKQLEKTMQSFQEIKDMRKGRAEEKDAFDLLDEL